MINASLNVGKLDLWSLRVLAAVAWQKSKGDRGSYIEGVGEKEADSFALRQHETPDPRGQANKDLPLT